MIISQSSQSFMNSNDFFFTSFIQFPGIWIKSHGIEFQLNSNNHKSTTTIGIVNQNPIWIETLKIMSIGLMWTV